MSRALVLGGGGPVGIAWEAGLVVGLAGHGVELGEADAIIGTSAGSNVGAQLALGHDLHEAVQRRDEADLRSSGGGSSGASMDDRLAELMETMAPLAAWDGPPEEARAKLGQFALEQDVGPEDRFIELFSALAGAGWPASFSCTAVNAMTGEFVVWDHNSGVDLQRAVASSCCVPGIFPPITIGDARYIDGGMRSPLNADLATGHDRVLVVSCMKSDLPGLGIAEEIDALEQGASSVELVEPDDAFVEISGSGMFLMDASRMPAAFDAGRALADVEAERLTSLWQP